MKIAWNIEELMDALSIGRNSAIRLGRESGAVVRIGRAVRYNVAKVTAYINEISGSGEAAMEGTDEGEG